MNTNRAPKILLLFAVAFFVSSCDLARQVEERAKVVNNYKVQAYNLAKENRLLKVKINELQYQIQTLEAKNSFLKVKLSKTEKASPERKIASVSPLQDVKNDLVKYDVYKWSPTQLLAIAENEFKMKNFEKSAQFFHTFLKVHPHLVEKSGKDADSLLFQAGVAAYESGEHYEWAKEHLGHLIATYPTSKYYRGAKLWMALSGLRLGEKDKFYETVEEFRKKYRNTPEWSILSGYYEEFVQKYKK